MGPRTASSRYCQAPNLPWAPVPPPHAAARSTVSHGSLYGLPLLLSPTPHSAMCHFQVSSHSCWVPFCHRMLQITGSHLLRPGPNLPWAPCTAFLTLLQSPQCLMGPCTASHIAAVSNATLLPCVTFRSPHTPAGFHFVS
ncbi:unnamed protein product [Staurois parvus]|uniref:Uncharacterized protein n=1 Tax=Staurois parvus TaxID=386267 RepID=A0ABN9BLB8_9NEOB|nr:unnamed protein product [Staurois parvus]